MQKSGGRFAAEHGFTRWKVREFNDLSYLVDDNFLLFLSTPLFLTLQPSKSFCSAWRFYFSALRQREFFFCFCLGGGGATAKTAEVAKPATSSMTSSGIRSRHEEMRRDRKPVQKKPGILKKPQRRAQGPEQTSRRDQIRSAYYGQARTLQGRNSKEEKRQGLQSVEEKQQGRISGGQNRQGLYFEEQNRQERSLNDQDRQGQTIEQRNRPGQLDQSTSSDRGGLKEEKNPQKRSVEEESRQEREVDKGCQLSQLRDRVPDDVFRMLQSHDRQMRSLMDTIKLMMTSQPTQPRASGRDAATMTSERAVTCHQSTQTDEVVPSTASKGEF